MDAASSQTDGSVSQAEGSVSQNEGSVVAVLHAQHARIRELLADVHARPAEERQRAFDTLRALLAAHETAEEVVVRPVSVQIANRDMLAARNHEERHILRLLAHLEKLDARGPEFGEALGPFEQALLAHLSMEETEEFPVLEAEVDARELRTMGSWIERAVALGPSHAHPLTAGSPTAQRAFGPFAALADHARDLLDRTRDETGEDK